MHVVLRGPHAPLGVEHVAARQHAHVVVGRRAQRVERVEVAAGQHDALRRREALLAHVRRVVVHHRHGEAHVVGQRRHLARSVGRAEQPHVHLIEQGHAGPGEALELLVVHRGAARDVLHLEHIARRVRARRCKLLRVVAEEHERLAVGGTHVAVLLRHFVVGVALRLVRIVDDLEAEPCKVAFVHRAQRTLERGNIVGREACRDHVEVGRVDVAVALGGLRREAREVGRRERRGATRLEVGDDASEDVFDHGNSLFDR